MTDTHVEREPALLYRAPTSQHTRFDQLERERIPHDRDVLPMSQYGEPSSGSMEMYGNSDTVLTNIIAHASQHWSKLTKW